VMRRLTLSERTRRKTRSRRACQKRENFITCVGFDKH